MNKILLGALVLSTATCGNTLMASDTSQESAFEKHLRETLRKPFPSNTPFARAVKLRERAASPFEFELPTQAPVASPAPPAETEVIKIIKLDANTYYI